MTHMAKPPHNQSRPHPLPQTCSAASCHAETTSAKKNQQHTIRAPGEQSSNFMTPSNTCMKFTCHQRQTFSVFPRTIQNSNGPNHLTATMAPNSQSYQQRRYFSVVPDSNSATSTETKLDLLTKSSLSAVTVAAPPLKLHGDTKGPSNHLAGTPDNC